MASLRNSPYLPLYVDAFISDEKLNECSAAACGVYIRILCLMHKSEEYGRIVIPSSEGPHRLLDEFSGKLSRNMPFGYDTIRDAVSELLDAGVLFIDGLSLCQKRMIRDAKLSEKRSNSGRLGMARRYAGNAPGRDASEERPVNLFGEEEAKAAEEPKMKPQRPKVQKTKYAEEVRMLESEYLKLVADYGEELTLKFIDKLNNYKLANHKRYADDYRAILSWVIERVLKDENNHGADINNNAGTRSPEQAGRRDYDETM